MPAMDYAKVAELYDVYAQTSLDVPFFIEVAQGCNAVLELTSGTGRLSVPLLEAGVPLTCLDSSPEMLARLRQKLERRGLSAPVYTADVCTFSLPRQFDLILIPFNAFGEITAPDSQRAALAAIRAHLAPGGRLIVTQHNPLLRLKACDGQIHLRGQFALPEGKGTLFLSSMERYDAQAQRVTGAQFYELYTPEGVLQSKRFVDLQFCVHSREAFEALARSQGFEVAALYGDYARTEFQPETSPYLIWTLRPA